MINNSSKNTDSKWISLEEAADYVGLGKTLLYKYAREKRIPANRLGKKWVFDKEDLDLWMKANQPVEKYFTSLDADIVENGALREPQREGYLRAVDFFSEGKNKAILQIPVGCGKSGLAAILPFGLANGRVLMIAPNLTIKEGLYEAMDITNRQKCFWRKAQVLPEAQLLSGPLVTTLESGNISVAEKAHIVVTNIQQLTNVDKWLHQFDPDFFDLIIVDEAHHSAADSWKRVIEYFSKAKIIHLTATPFRSDRQELDGELVYRYPFRSATLKGYIKRLKASYVAPKEIQLSFRDKTGKTYTLDDVLVMKEKDWFSRGVALSPACNQHIVDNSLQKLEDLRQTGTRHQLIAVACSINHAKDICAMYRERGYSAEIIHSDQTEEEKSAVKAQLKNGTLDCIVQVQMLGEGFDHPKLSVAAIFRPFRSLAPYVQFVGRIMRVVVQNDPSHPDNLGHIVTHLGMNLDERLKEFKQFENDDEAFWDKVIGGQEPEVSKEVKEGVTRKRLGESDAVVDSEIVDSLWEEDFTTVDDKHLIEELQSKLRSLGMDPAMATRMVKESQSGIGKQVPAAQPFAKQPLLEWEEARKRLNDQVKRTANVLLNNVDLKPEGREMSFKYKKLGASGSNNFVVALTLVNKEVEGVLKKERSACSAEEFKAAIKELEPILQKLVRRVKKIQSEYEKNTKG